MKYLIVAALIVICSNVVFARTDSTDLPKKPDWINDSIPREKIFVANIRNNTNFQDMSHYKIEAAMALACLVSNKYQLVPFDLVDTTVKKIIANNQEPTAQMIADSLDADVIAFLAINQLENMVRIDFSGIPINNPEVRIRGFGYASIQYRNANNDEPILDPTLLKAVQRALISYSDDDSLYAHAVGSFKQYNAKSLVIGGIEFKNDEDQIPWSLFAKQVIYSYDGIETIYDAIAKSPHYAVYDIASRDSMYAKYRMYTVENYRPVSVHEIEVMNNFEVDYYIGGSFERTSEGATINLFIARVLPENAIKVIRENSAVLREDDILKFRTELSRLARQLLDDQAQQ